MAASIAQAFSALTKIRLCVVKRAIPTARSEDAGVPDVAKIVASHAVIETKVLQLVNSVSVKCYTTPRLLLANLIVARMAELIVADQTPRSSALRAE